MKIRYIAFKWHVNAPLDAVIAVLKQVKLVPGKGNVWRRSIGVHTLQVEARMSMCSADQSFFWIRFFQEGGFTDKTALDRVLADWFFTMSKHFVTCVNWMQAAVESDGFQSVYGFSENTPKIWSKADKQLRFSFFPIQDYYLYDVKNEDIRLAIPHRRYSLWLDELQHNLLGHQKPDDQISLDLVI